MSRVESETEPQASEAQAVNLHDRSTLARLWYLLVQAVTQVYLIATGGLRAGGRSNIPASGPALLVSNHVSYLDVFVIGIPLHRPLNYVARSTLFLPVLGSLIRSVGGFPIQRDGMGASGLKETFKRLRRGGIVILFPEGTRSLNGEFGELKSGIAVLAAKAKVPIIPAAVAGTFESWPRRRLLPFPHPVRIEYGPPILPETIKGLSTEQTTLLIRQKMLECQQRANEGLRSDLGRCADAD